MRLVFICLVRLAVSMKVDKARGYYTSDGLQRQSCRRAARSETAAILPLANADVPYCVKPGFRVHHASADNYKIILRDLALGAKRREQAKQRQNSRSIHVDVILAQHSLTRRNRVD